MQLKLRQIVLYGLSCFILALSGLPAGGLIALALLFQIVILLKGWNLTKQSQLGMFKLVLSSTPLLLFWGGAHSFVFLYLQEKTFLMFFMAASLSYILILMIYFQMIFTLNYIQKNEFRIRPTFSEAFSNIKNDGKVFMQESLALFVLSLVPFLHVEWKLVFAITAICLYRSRRQLKTAFLGSSTDPRSN